MARPSRRVRARRFLRRYDALEWLAVALAAPLLLFPTVRPGLTGTVLVFLAVVWLLRWSATGEAWPLTAFNGALLLFTLMIPVGMWASAVPDLTLPKATGLILGLAVFRALALTVRTRRGIVLAGGVYALVGLVISAVGALSVRWLGKVAGVGAVAGHIPQLIEGLPSVPAGGVNPNQLAGALALYLPLAAALTGWGWARRGWQRWLWGLVSLTLLLSMGALLVLTQSRSGWAGGAGGLAVLALMGGATSNSRRKRLAGVGASVALLLAIVAIVLVVGPQTVGAALDGGGNVTAMGDVVGPISMAARTEIWSRALYGVQDFAFTGCGLGTFRQVVHVLYPLFLIGPDTDFAHAHNVFLQTALDLGVAGLIAYVALLSVALALCWRSARRGRGVLRAIALGLFGGLVGLHIYGLADALALGSKPAVAFWFALGLVAALQGEWDTD